MLMTETSAVNEEVLDAVAELTNMIVGSVKTELEQHLGPLGLSIPTVVFGRNFKTKSAGTNEWTVARFHWDGELLLVKLCLAPKERAAHAVVSLDPASLAIGSLTRNGNAYAHYYDARKSRNKRRRRPMRAPAST